MASETRFADLRRRLEAHGWTLDRINGSHHIFVKEGEDHISVPVHGGRVKPGYIRRIEKRLGISLR
jgi:predicted RNA binding protein YcfA (HicA-like mRNA interferase family)